MNENKRAGEQTVKKTTEQFDPAKEKDIDELVHEAHEPNSEDDMGIVKEKDPDDLIHNDPILIKPGTLPDPETIPIDDDIDDEIRR
jgi:hypothetical protein